MRRLNAKAPDGFFDQFVFRYHDKQYQTWLGAHFTQVGIDDCYDKGLQDRIAAGIISYFFDTSFPSAMKLIKDKPRHNRIPQFEQLFDRTEKRFLAESHVFFSSRRPEMRDDHWLLPHAELFMLRLLTSFRAARYLLNWGFFSEPLTILRSSLEQLAWCSSLGVTFDARQFANPQPSKCIGSFKKRFPAAGTLYGVLSEFSHMEFEAQKHFVVGNPEIAGVMQQSTEFKFFGLVCYSFLIIAYQSVCRDLSGLYREHYGLNYRLPNSVLPLRHLIGHALMRPELDGDEIATRLTENYFAIFPRSPASVDNRA